MSTSSDIVRRLVATGCALSQCRIGLHAPRRSRTVPPMSNKSPRRAARAAAAPKRRPTTVVKPLSSPRLRVSTGMMIGGGLVAAISALLPWQTLAGVDRAGIAAIPGLGTLVLGLVVAALGVFVLLRADHPMARQAAWGGLVAALGIGVMGVVAVLTTDKAAGVTVAAGVLPAIAGGMVATMGVRGVVERR